MSSFRGLRLARPGDEARLFDFCLAAFNDNGWGGLDEDNVRAVLDAACRGDRGYVIALADGPERIEAAIGLQPSRIWYGDDNSWFLTELFVFVHPEHRRSRHAQRLLRFAKWWAEQSDCPVILNVHPRTQLLEKTALFQRYGKLVGTTLKF